MQNYRNGRLIPTLVTATDQSIHRRLRTPVARIFSMSTLLQLEPGIDETILELIQQFAHKYAEPQRRCDIDNWMRYCTCSLRASPAVGLTNVRSRFRCHRQNFL